MAFPNVIDTNPLGQVNLAGSDLALFLKIFSGEVIERAKEFTIMDSKVVKRVLKNAQTAQFPGIGQLSGAYHARGQDILDESATNPIIQQVKHGELTIQVDRPLMTAVGVDDLESIVNHYDVRGPYANAFAKFFMERWDRDVMRLMLKAATAASGTYAVTTDHPDGAIITETNADTVAADLLSALEEAERDMDEKMVASEGRYCLLKPQQYNLLTGPSAALLDRDFGGEGNGRAQDGTVMRAWGFDIIKTNLLPQDDSTGESTTGQNGETYIVDARNTVALCGAPGAIGAVEAMPLAMSTEKDWKTRQDVLIGSRATGLGVLRPEHCIQIRTAAPV